MGRLETSIPNPIPGAGRIIDYTWPQTSLYAAASGGVMRNNATAPVIAPTTTGFGGGGGSGAGVLNGAQVWQIQSSGVAGNGNSIALPNVRVVTPTTIAPAFAPAVNDLQCWRIVWVCAMFAVPALTGEATAALVVNSNNQNWINSLNEGFGFRFMNDGTVTFSTVKGGVLSGTVVSPGGFSFLSTLHAYELIVVGATATTDATLICKIDGVVRALPANKSSWAAGTILPVQQNIGAVQPGWLPCAVNISNVVNSLYTHQIRVIAGPTVDSLF